MDRLEGSKLCSTAVFLALLALLTASTPATSHPQGAQKDAVRARHDCDTSSDSSGMQQGDWVSDIRLGEAALSTTETGVEAIGPYKDFSPDDFSEAVHSSQKSFCVMTGMGADPSLMDFMTADYSGSYQNYPVTAKSKAYVEAQGIIELEQDFASAYACYDFPASSDNADEESFSKLGRCNIVGAPLDFAVLTAGDPLAYPTFSNVTLENRPAPWSNNLTRVPVMPGFSGVMFAMGRTGHMYTDLFTEYHNITVPHGDLSQKIDVARGHKIGNLTAYVRSRKGMSTLKTCDNISAIYMQSYREEALASPLLYCATTNLTRKYRLNVVTTVDMAWLNIDHGCDNQEANPTVFMAYRPSPDTWSFTADHPEYGMLWLVVAAPNQVPNWNSAIYIDSPPDVPIDPMRHPKDYLVVTSNLMLAFLHGHAFGKSSLKGLTTACPSGYFCGFNNTRAPNSDPERSYQQVRAANRGQSNRSNSIFAVPFRVSSRSRQITEPCLLLKQEQPAGILSVSDINGGTGAESVGEGMARHVLSTSSATLFDLRVASLRANATYYTASAAVSATVPGFMAAIGISIVDVQGKLLAAASTLRFQPWIQRQSIMLRAYFSVTTAIILHVVSALPSITFLWGIVSAQLQTEVFTYGNSNLRLRPSYIVAIVYITTTVTMRNHIPWFVAKVAWVSVVLILHLFITLLQALTILKSKPEKLEAESCGKEEVM